MKQTTLELNGPIISFTQNPVGVASTGVGIGSTGGGTATFVGIATVTFPTQVPANSATGTGNISYQWYESGAGALSDSTYVTGTATTTLTLSNLITPTDDKKQFYVIADYVASAYQSSSPITAGTARSTGNAINDPLSSSVGTLTVYPLIIITDQPGAITDLGEFIGIVTSVINTPAIFNVVATTTNSTDNLLSYQWSLNGTNLTNSSTVSGANSAQLSLTLPNVGINTVGVVITHPNAGNSPISSGIATANFVIPREILNIEKYAESSLAELLSVDLYQTSYTFNSENITDYICLYASEKDLNIEVELYGPKGSNASGYSGGEGGYSKIRFVMKKNEEFMLTSMFSGNTPSLYRKSSLIATVGEGGNAGARGNGGAGGGVGIAGANGQGQGGGTGGVVIVAGTLPSSGIFGYASSLTPISPDTKATGTTGGRILPCPRGNYWRNQGKSPCENLGNIQFFLSNGTKVTNSATIDRGYKAGYTIIQTGGQGAGEGSSYWVFDYYTDSQHHNDGCPAGSDLISVQRINKRFLLYTCRRYWYRQVFTTINYGGDGGDGATGGTGGTTGGGGGGSGYTDGSVTVVSTQQGGSTGTTAQVIFRTF